MVGAKRQNAKPRMPARPCLRCSRPTTCRRNDRPVCLKCWVRLTERKADKDLRSAGRKL